MLYNKTVTISQHDIVQTSTDATVTSTDDIIDVQVGLNSTKTLQKMALNDTDYEVLIRLCLLRHWTFLVMSGLKGVPDQGYQFVVFANECKRLKSLIGVIENENYLSAIMNTLAEFTDIHALNYLLLLTKIFDIEYDIVNALATYKFNLSNFNSVVSNYEEWYEANNEGTIDNDATPTIDQFDVNGNSTFIVNGLEAEHYKINPTLAQATTAARTDDRESDRVGMELELVYSEM